MRMFAIMGSRPPPPARRARTCSKGRSRPPRRRSRSTGTSATTSGVATFEAEDDLTLNYEIQVTDLTGPATAAHIHEGAPGVPGGIVIPLTVSGSIGHDRGAHAGAGREAPERRLLRQRSPTRTRSVRSAARSRSRPSRAPVAARRSRGTISRSASTARSRSSTRRRRNRPR